MTENMSILGAEYLANDKFFTAFTKMRQVKVDQVRRSYEGHTTDGSKQDPENAFRSTELFLEQ